MLLPTPSSCSGHSLQRELNARAAAYATRYDLPCELGMSSSQSLVFADTTESDLPGHHGNFHPASYRAIRGDSAWMRRLEKPHTGWKRVWTRSRWQWHELDCAVSSDALLMNIFCYPRLLYGSTMAALLGVEVGARPHFGVHPRLAQVRSLVDTTEVDMQLGDLLVEAKLTEAGFQKGSPALLDRYAGWQQVLDPEALPRSPEGDYRQYQLLRGILAAAAGSLRFCVVCDSRRADLIEAWFSVMPAVRTASLRCRLALLTWQELAAAAPKPLARWLTEKYGIVPRA